MPNAPQLEGLPLWLQLILTVAFGLGTLAVAFKGYRKGSVDATAAPTGGQGEQIRILAASIADTGSQRHLADTVVQLTGAVINLDRGVGDLTHWVRSKFEQDREICQRLRELKEELERGRPNG
jgi:hypothetical protein